MGLRAGHQSAKSVRLTVLVAGLTILAHLFLLWQSSMLTKVPGFTLHPAGFESRLFERISGVKAKMTDLLERSGRGDQVAWAAAIAEVDAEMGAVLSEWNWSSGGALAKEPEASDAADVAVGSRAEDKIQAVIDRSTRGVDLGLGDRPKVKVFIGVFTGFNDPGKKTKGSEADKYDYKKRRAALRDTWFPKDKQQRDRLQKDKSIVVRFVVGHSADPNQEQLMAEEEEDHKDFIRLPVMESYHGLTNKTKNYFTTAAALYDADWYVKVDDDVYLMVERILLAAKQWAKMGAGYIGCMKHGYVWKDENTRWYEPKNLLLGNEYYLHAYGSIYVMAKKTVEEVIIRNYNNLRFFANEDTTVGSWMLGHNITHFEDMRLCATKCSSKAVGILRNECAGLCDPLKDLYLVHNYRSCRSPAEDPLPYLPSHPEHVKFEKMRV